MSKTKLKRNDVSNLSDTELLNKIEFIKKELFNLRFQTLSGELKDTSNFKLLRRNVARLKTEANIRGKNA